MARRSKRYMESKSRVDQNREYGLSEAIDTLKSTKKAAFDETVEIAVSLGIDPKNSDQQVRTSVGLPHGTGKSVRVAVFAEGEDAQEALDAGADFAGGDDLIARVEGGWMEFDIALATPPMMRKIGQLGRFLGPRGLMPNPKNGTLRQDIGQGVQEFKAGKVELRNDSGGNVHAPVGKLSFDKQNLEENINEVLQHLQGVRPPGLKRRFFQKAVLTSTMGPGIRLVI